MEGGKKLIGIPIRQHSSRPREEDNNERKGENKMNRSYSVRDVK